MHNFLMPNLYPTSFMRRAQINNEKEKQQTDSVPYMNQRQRKERSKQEIIIIEHIPPKRRRQSYHEAQ